MSSGAQVISCKAAVAWAKDAPLVIETVEVDPPKAGEVRIKLISTGICHTDYYFLSGANGEDIFPTILGHEGAGVVESVGDGVIKFQPGDHVIPLYVSQCGKCRICQTPGANFCQKFGLTQRNGQMPDGTTRFHCKGKDLRHFMGVSSFTEYTVVPELSLVKINKQAPLEKVCLLGCGIPTGYGAALNTAAVRPGSICAIWGLGAVGLAAVMGCKKAGAARIIGVDINPAKSAIGMKFGCTEFINPKDYNEPIHNVLMGLTAGGLDYSFECCGTAATTEAAFEALVVGSGVAVVLGATDASHNVTTKPMQLILGRTWKGSMFGGWRPDQVPQLVDDYINKSLMVDEFITHTMSLDKINDAFDLMHKGESIRSVVHF